MLTTLPFPLAAAPALHAQDTAGRASGLHAGRVPLVDLDSVFQDLDRADGPGCAVSVMQEGAPVVARGYGMANLEYAVPIEPSSVFHVASVSKQFTAFAVELLVADGLVAWDDDIRDYVPELPDSGHRIELEHLVHHTSGIRDQWELLIMAGWRWEADVVRQRDVLDVLGRQRGLNFEPGTDWLYSNSGYTLLAAVVERVTGKSLRAFSEERIFGPLGMDRTHFRDDHEAVVPGRAYAYAPDAEAADGWKISIPDFAIVGASSLFTTVEDLAKWERNFRTAEVGGRDVVEGMLHRVAIAGERHGYAHGLFAGDHRGLRTVSHGGADAGYRSHFLRYPGDGVAVAVLCNDPGADPAGRARRVAELWLTDAFTEPPEERPGDAAPTDLADAREEALTGWYATPVNDLPVRILRSDETGRLSFATGNRSPLPLVADSDSSFQVGSGSTRLVVPDDRGEWGRSVVIDDGTGTPIRYTRVPAADTSAGSLDAYMGWYWSDELGVFYEVRKAEGGGLELWQRRHGALAASPMHRDAFSTYFGFLALRFIRSDGGRVDGFTLSAPRTWRVAFRRVERPAP